MIAFVLLATGLIVLPWQASICLAQVQPPLSICYDETAILRCDPSQRIQVQIAVTGGRSTNVRCRRSFFYFYNFCRTRNVLSNFISLCDCQEVCEASGRLVASTNYSSRSSSIYSCLDLNRRSFLIHYKCVDENQLLGVCSNINDTTTAPAAKTTSKTAEDFLATLRKISHKAIIQRNSTEKFNQTRNYAPSTSSTFPVAALAAVCGGVVIVVVTAAIIARWCYRSHRLNNKRLNSKTSKQHIKPKKIQHAKTVCEAVDTHENLRKMGETKEIEESDYVAPESSSNNTNGDATKYEVPIRSITAIVELDGYVQPTNVISGVPQVAYENLQNAETVNDAYGAAKNCRVTSNQIYQNV